MNSQNKETEFESSFTPYVGADFPELSTITKWTRFKDYLPWLVLMICAVLSYMLLRGVEKAQTKEFENYFHFRVREVVSKTEQRIHAYEQGLRSVQGLYSSSRSVERDEFKSFVSMLQLSDHYPGVQGVGFSLIIPPPEKARHIATIRKQGFPEYTIKPEGNRELYTSIIYLEPFTGRNLRAFGYDMYSEPVRREAMIRARDTGQAAMSGKVVLVQETEQSVQAGFLLYLPVYRNDKPHATLEQRRANIVGWVYSPFRMDDLMNGVYGERNHDLDIHIYDGDEISDSHLLHNSSVLSTGDSRLASRISSIQHIKMAGRTWTIQVFSQPVLESRINMGQPYLIVAGASIVSLLLTLLTWSMVNGRKRAIQLARKINRRLIDNEQALRDSEKKLQTALDNATIAIGLADDENNIAYLNHKFTELFGYTLNDISCINEFYLRVCPDAALRNHLVTELQADIVATRQKGTAFQPKEMEITCKDGSIRHAIFSPGWVGTDLMLAFSDITKQKRIEAEQVVQYKRISEINAQLVDASEKLTQAHSQLLQSEKMAAIGILAAGVAHEINNPIGYVNSNLGTLENYLADIFIALDKYESTATLLEAEHPQLKELCQYKEKVDLNYIREDTKSLIAESHQGLQRVKNIVLDLKGFSRSDKADEWVWADVHKGLESTLNIVWNELKYKCTLKKEYGELPEIYCLPSQLNQVFLNLLVNAAQAIEVRGEITIRTGHEGVQVWIEICDTGKGIPPENISHLFEPFFTTKPVGKGTGLGLSVSYAIVEKHHGKIEVESEVGKGTTFRIWLPVQQPIIIERN